MISFKFRSACTASISNEANTTRRVFFLRHRVVSLCSARGPKLCEAIAPNRHCQLQSPPSEKITRIRPDNEPTNEFLFHFVVDWVQQRGITHKQRDDSLGQYQQLLGNLLATFEW